jgi:glycosyltransferase involved in cell wall biosynthesis
MPTVDVIIPCYNYGRYLRTCVASVLSQVDVDIRILLIDDASSDDTALVGQELADSNRAVTFRTHEVNRGNIATYNEGLIDWSTAEYTVLLSADDILTAGSLSRAVHIMDADKKVGMVYGRAIHFERESELPRVSARKFAYSRFSGSEWLEGRCRSGHNVITSPEVVVRGVIQRAVGGYRPELPHSGDLEMWLRIAAVSNIAYVRGIPQAFYRVHSASMMRTKFSGSFLDMSHRKKAFDSFFREYGDIVRSADRLQDLANRALAREALWDACRAYDHNRVEEGRVVELEEFAMATYPAATKLAEYAALNRRRRLGPLLCNRVQPFAPMAAVVSFRRWLRKEHWKRFGT